MIAVLVLILAFKTEAAPSKTEAALPCNKDAFPNVRDCSMIFSGVPNVTIRGVRLVNVFIQFTNVTNVTLEDVDSSLTKSFSTGVFLRLEQDFVRFHSMIWFEDVLFCFVTEVWVHRL